MIQLFGKFKLGTKDELVIKVALAIANQDPNIKFDSFTVRTSRKIESNWDIIQRSLLITGAILRKFGFDQKKTFPTKEAAIIPIALFIAEGEHFDLSRNVGSERILTASSYNHVRRDILEFIAYCQLLSKWRFWGKQNSKKISALVTAIRTSTSSNPHEFPITAIKKYMNKIDSFGLTRKQVSDLVVNAKFGDPIVYGIFALCCPNIFMKDKVIVDYVFSLKGKRHASNSYYRYVCNLMALTPQEAKAREVGGYTSGRMNESWFWEKDGVIKRNYLGKILDHDSRNVWFDERDKKLIDRLQKAKIIDVIPENHETERN